MLCHSVFWSRLIFYMMDCFGHTWFTVIIDKRAHHNILCTVLELMLWIWGEEFMFTQCISQYWHICTEASHFLLTQHIFSIISHSGNLVNLVYCGELRGYSDKLVHIATCCCLVKERRGFCSRDSYTGLAYCTDVDHLCWLVTHIIITDRIILGVWQVYSEEVKVTVSRLRCADMTQLGSLTFSIATSANN